MRPTRTSCRRSCSRRRSPPRAESSTCSSTAARRSTVTAPNFTLTLLLMVVIGGAGSRWGAVLGGILYTYLNNRLVAIGSSSAVEGLPEGLRTPLEQPLFLLGIVFILIVVFLPGGLAGLVGARPAARASTPREGGATSPARTPSHRRKRERGDANGDVRIAYEVHGDGEPLLSSRASATTAAAGGRSRPARARTSACSSSTIAASATVTCPTARTRSRRWPRMRSRCSTPQARERARLGVSLGGLVAQELVSRTRARRKLVLAFDHARAARTFPMPQRDARGCSRRFPTMEREAGFRLMRRELARRVRVRERPSSWMRSSPTGSRTRPTSPAGRRRPTRRDLRRDAAARRSRVPTLVLHGERRRRRRPAQRDLLAELIPNARLELVRRARAPVRLGGGRAPRTDRARVPAVSGTHTHRPLDPRPRPAHAGARRDRLRRRLVTYRELDEGSDPLAAALSRAASRAATGGDADGQLAGARHGLLRVREARADAAAALVAAVAVRAALPARRRGARAVSRRARVRGARCVHRLRL